MAAGDVGPFGLTALRVEAAFIPDIDDAVTNVNVSPHSDGYGWAVSGDTTIGTDLVATFTRRIYEGPNGIIARHIRLDVSPYYQGRGYAKALLRASFRLYAQLRIAHVELDSVGDGSLVWPRLGWSLHGPSIREVHEEIGYVYSSHHGRRPPVDFPIAVFGPDILELEDHAGNRVGEEALIRFARSSREISMRLYPRNARAAASLHRHGIL